MDYVKEFEKEKKENIEAMTKDKNTSRIARLFMNHTMDYKYGYYFTWMGRPIIQNPNDMINLQEIIMKVQPDLIIETGIAHGGSLIFSASMLELLDASNPLDGIKREVVGVDIEIRPHNRKSIEEHPMYKRITMFEGSSTDENIVNEVRKIAENHKTVMVLLDSLHTHDHVLTELKLYSPLVSVNSYCVVYDTIIEFEDREYKDRPWSKGNNPYTAVIEFLQDEEGLFTIDKSIEEKSVITACPSGWLKRVK